MPVIKTHSYVYFSRRPWQEQTRSQHPSPRQQTQLVLAFPYYSTYASGFSMHVRTRIDTLPVDLRRLSPGCRSAGSIYRIGLQTSTNFSLGRRVTLASGPGRTFSYSTWKRRGMTQKRILLLLRYVDTSSTGML